MTAAAGDAAGSPRPGGRTDPLLDISELAVRFGPYGPWTG